MFLLTQVLFVCILCNSGQRPALWNTMKIFSIRGMDVARENRNVKHYSKHEILLLDTCVLYICVSPDWVGQYLVTYHNNVTHISSAVSHYV